jgi:hypothetical protein
MDVRTPCTCKCLVCSFVFRSCLIKDLLGALTWPCVHAVLLDPGGPEIASRIAFALAGSTQLVTYRLGTHTLFNGDEARSLHLRYGLHALCLRFTLVVTFQLTRLDTGPVSPATPAGLSYVSRREAPAGQVALIRAHMH